MTQELYQREKLLNRVRKLDGRASEEESYWKNKRQEKEKQRKLARKTSEKKPKEQEQGFVSARLYHQQQQEQEAKLNAIYPSQATEEEWIEIQRQWTHHADHQ